MDEFIANVLTVEELLYLIAQYDQALSDVAMPCVTVHKDGSGSVTGITTYGPITCFRFHNLPALIHGLRTGRIDKE